MAAWAGAIARRPPEGCGTQGRVVRGVVAVLRPWQQSSQARGRSPVTQRKYIAITLLTTLICPNRLVVERHAHVQRDGGHL
jgi:hypothetical protein